MTDLELYGHYRGWTDPPFLDLSLDDRRRWADVAAAVHRWGEKRYDDGYQDGWNEGAYGE